MKLSAEARENIIETLFFLTGKPKEQYRKLTDKKLLKEHDKFSIGVAE